MEKVRTKLSLHKVYDFCDVESPQKTVILIHGIATDATFFDEALVFFKAEPALKDIRFVAFDLLGSGKSTKDDELDYSYDDQLAALHNAINELNVTTPLVLVGHSMGTLIATRYASKYDDVEQLILVSPPIYSEADLTNPAFDEAVKIFEQVISAKDPSLAKEKSFRNSMELIVKNNDNYKTLVGLKIPTTLIYGNEDKFIGAHNIPAVLKAGAGKIKAIETIGKHGLSKEKYIEISKILKVEQK